MGAVESWDRSRRGRVAGDDEELDALMVTSEQPTTDLREHAVVPDPWAVPGPAAERAARAALKAQVSRLERELSAIIADGFPHISSACGTATRVEASAGALRGAPAPGGPRLLTLAELERLRDRLATRVRQAQGETRERDVSERRARELLERMKAQPADYKFVRLPVVDLGERGCGVWEVRPRLGLIGMLAGWWQLKLSSGCPLAPGPRATRGPGLIHLRSSAGSRSRWPTDSIAARVRRWRSVIDPTVLVSDIGTSARNLRARLSPQRRWLVNRSETAMLSASQGQSRITCATPISPVAILRLSSARARRTLFARSSARMY
jgi:hypothetical protein